MAKEQVESTGILLKVTPYKEADCILHVYFLEYGKMSLLAKGLRKQKSKFAGVCQELTEITFTFIPSTSLCTMISAQKAKSYPYIFKSIDAQAYATLIAEYYYRSLEQNAPSRKHYHFLKTCLEYLNSGYNYETVYSLMLSFILKDQGLTPEVNQCVICGKTSHIAQMSISAGGFLCQDHMNGEQIHSKEVLQAFRYFVLSSIDQIDVFERYDDTTIHEACGLLVKFYDEYCPIRLNARKFIRNS